MKEVMWVNAKDMKTLEEYGAALLSGMMSLKTLEAYHVFAFKKGLLNEDEQETGKTICWEINRLFALYRAQLDHILERTELDEQAVLESLSLMMTGKQRKSAKRGKQNELNTENK
jgi:hypothetical protein